jgi:kynurenine 3-monooxygenase
MVLAQCLRKHVSTKPESIQDKKRAIRMALQEYSLRQVPEGHALYEMSVGALPRSEATPSTWEELLLGIKRVIRVVSNGLDTVFGGRFGIGQQPIQTRFTTSLESFASIRRSRELYFDEAFRSEEEYQRELTNLSELMEKKVNIV